MNRALKYNAWRFVAGGLGFVAAFTTVKWLSGAPPKPRRTITQSVMVDPGLSLAAPASLPTPGQFTAMEPNARLAFSVRLRGLSAARREEFLQQCLSRTEPERTSLLSLLLLDWAATEPAAA
jgi:hypothetical protein